MLKKNVSFYRFLFLVEFNYPVSFTK